MATIKAIILLVLGFVLLIKGADWFVDGAAGLAARFGIPELVIGLTIVAMGTSAPEAAVSITSALAGSAGITVGNVVGSNIMNILLILGLTAVVIPIPIQRSTQRFEIPFMIAISVIFLVEGYLGGSITRPEGLILWGAFVLYFIYLLILSKKSKETQSEDEPKKNRNIFLQLLGIVVGAVAIVFGSDFVVDGATEIAKLIGMSDRIIGLTVVAFGTSLPELVTSVTAARKGSADIAIGNIVGSNIFNLLFVAGTTAVITPVVFASNFIVDTLVSIAAAVLLLITVLNKDKKIKRWGGVAMLIAYAGYFVYLLQ